jgi:HMG (high mobility group) box
VSYYAVFAALPKRPHSAWQIFLTDQLPNMQHNGKISVASATAQLGPQWKSMSEQEKQVGIVMMKPSLLTRVYLADKMWDFL